MELSDWKMRVAWVYLYSLTIAGERALWYGAGKNKGNNNIRINTSINPLLIIHMIGVKSNTVHFFYTYA